MPDHPHGHHVRAAAWSADAAKRRRPWSDVVATFAALADAEADAFERELAAWSAPGFDPFAFDAGCLFTLTSLPADVLRDWLLDHGVDPPGAVDAWPDWHARTRPDPLVMMTALDKLRLFDVTEAWPTAYLVANPPERWWQYRDRRIYRELALAPLAGFSTEATAEVHAAAIVSHLTQSTPEPAYADPRDFARVVPVASRVRSAASCAALVSRFFDVSGNGDITMPVVLCPDRAAADAAVARLDTAARRSLNPFAVFELSPAEPAALMEVLHLADVSVAYLEPTARFGTDWSAWYDAEQAQLTDRDRAVIWEHAAGRPLYTVTEVEFDGGGA